MVFLVFLVVLKVAFRVRRKEMESTSPLASLGRRVSRETPGNFLEVTPDVSRRRGTVFSFLKLHSIEDYIFGLILQLNDVPLQSRTGW